MKVTIKKIEGEYEGWLVWRGRFEVLLGKFSIEDDHDGLVVVESGDVLVVL